VVALPDESLYRVLMLAADDFEEVMRALDSIIERPPWYADAACRGMDQRLFFPPRGETADEARAVCASCPVREPCRALAVDEQLDGIWGGTSRRQRRQRRAR
jgi:WhiB family redox-sensing transcriptional regulator